MTVPVWVWAASAAGLITAVTAEIVLTGRPVRPGASGAVRGSFTTRQATGWVAVYVSLAVLCGLGIGHEYPAPPEFWQAALRDAGFTEVGFQPVVAEAGLVRGVRP